MNVVVIKPRYGVEPIDIVHFLRCEFQQVGQSGNPLINADIDVVEQTSTEREAVEEATRLRVELGRLRQRHAELLGRLVTLTEQARC
jgi:hypothetical protein